MVPDLKENRTRGILWMLATMFCFIALDTMMKYLMETYSLVQVTWARFFFASVVALVACGPRRKGSKPGRVSACGRPAVSAASYRGILRGLP